MRSIVGNFIFMILMLVALNAIIMTCPNGKSASSRKTISKKTTRVFAVKANRQRREK